MRKTVFDHISKHLEVHQKYSTAHHIFNSLLGVWKCNPTQSSVFDILHQRLPSSLKNFTTETEWMHGLNLHIMHLSMLSHWVGGRAQVGDFTVVIIPQWGLFNGCFNSLSSDILLTFSSYFDNPQMPRGGAFEQKLSAQFKCPAYARPSPPAANINNIHLVVVVV